MSTSISTDDLLAQVMQRNEKIQESPAAKAAPELGIESLSKSMQEAAESVFSKMCGIQVTHTGTAVGAAEQRQELSGIVGISGSMKATTVINIDTDLAFAISEAFLGERPTEVDAGVVDMIGELANMIGGNAKERLSAPGLSLGLPTVITGDGHCVAFAHDMQLRVISFECESGNLQLEVGCSSKQR